MGEEKQPKKQDYILKLLFSTFFILITTKKAWNKEACFI